MAAHVGPPQLLFGRGGGLFGASYACVDALRACLASGARRVGVDVCAGGVVNSDLAAREAEVGGL